MIEHMVLFKVKSEARSKDVETLLSELKTLRERVPGIQELSCGANTSERSQGYTHGLFVRFRSRMDLEAYISHPDHQRVVTECIRPIVDDILVVDYEA